MKELYESALLSFSEVPTDIIWHPNSTKFAVIMDPRYDKLMVGVIKNFMHHLNPHGWNLIIITHEKYAEQAKTEFPNCQFIWISETHVYYNESGVPNINIDTYNGILMSNQFWNFIPGEHILIFQKDCYMYKMFDETVYLNYAFCGANCLCISTDNNQSIVINGGCSLRKKSEMLECLQLVSWSERDVKHFNSNNEDIFFTVACELLKKNIPNFWERPKFAIENQESDDTCFYHGWNKDYQTEEQARFLLYR